MLTTLHSSHMGVTKTTERARVIFQPNMQKDIEVHLASCRPCAEYNYKTEARAIVA